MSATTAADKTAAVIRLGLAALLWTAMCLLILAPVSLALSVLPAGFPLAVAVEALFHLVAALLVFALLRLIRPPRWFWLAGPAGYLLSVAVYFGMTWIAGGVMTVESGYWYVFAADLAAVTLGAYLASTVGHAREAGSPDPDTTDLAAGPAPDTGSDAVPGDS